MFELYSTEIVFVLIDVVFGVVVGLFIALMVRPADACYSKTCMDFSDQTDDVCRRLAEALKLPPSNHRSFDDLVALVGKTYEERDVLIERLAQARRAAQDLGCSLFDPSEVSHPLAARRRDQEYYTKCYGCEALLVTEKRVYACLQCKKSYCSKCFSPDLGRGCQRHVHKTEKSTT